MEDLPRVIEEVFSLVNLDLYGVAGVLEGDRLLVTAFREGASNVYAYTPEEGLVKLNREPVSMVAEPPRGAGRVVIARDVARGRELHRAFIASLESPGEERPLVEGLEPMRLLSLVDKGDKVYLTGVTPDGVGVFEARPGSDARRVGLIPGLGALEDVAGRVGVGIIFQQTGRIPLFTIDLDSGEARIVETPGSVTAVRASPEGWVALGVEGAREAGLYRFDPETGRVEPLELAGRGLREYRPTMISYIGFTGRGEAVVVAWRGVRSRVFLDGDPVEGPEGGYGRAYDWRGGLVATYTSLRRPHSVVHLKDGRAVTLLSDRLPDWLEEALGDVRVHDVEAPDGERVPVITLESRRAGRPGPTVVHVHGGPFAADVDAWGIFAAALALAGFNVVMVNYRGSMGFGEEWRSKIIGDPCGAELDDIVAAARWARESGLASYTAIMGYSYGGYMTMCALTRRPGEFAAGVAGASVVDWEEMYELSDPAFKAFIELLFAGDKSRWRERSPITHLDNLRDPLCIIHPQNDSRTPLKPVLHFMEKALEKGKRFEAHIAPDMGHAVNTADDVVKILLPAIIFLYRIKTERAAGTQETK